MRRLPPLALSTAASKTAWLARQMSGPVPSPSMKGRMGWEGTSRRPSGRDWMRSPAGTVMVEYGGMRGPSNKKTRGGATWLGREGPRSVQIAESAQSLHRLRGDLVHLAWRSAQGGQLRIARGGQPCDHTWSLSGQITQLVGIVGQAKQLRLLTPGHQLPRRGPDHLRVFPERECHLPRRLAETRPLEPECVGRDPRHIEYRRRDVDRLDRIEHAPAPGLAGKLHDQRDVDLGLVERA